MEKIKFAQLISMISAMSGRKLDEDELRDIEALTKSIATVFAVAEIENLLDAMKQGAKINAIKAYRAMTGASLIDSKNTIERYSASRDQEAA